MRWCWMWAVMMLTAGAALTSGCATTSRSGVAAEHSCTFRTVPLRHTHMTRLLANAMGYLDREHKLFDEVSGYPCEGWNDDPVIGLRLRGFTQLTAIGAWMELLGQVVAGRADSPHLSRREAWIRLEQVVDHLLADQEDHRLSDRGLLCNFMGFGTEGRIPPLASVARKADFHEHFGKEQGEAIWQALKQRGWIKSWQGDDGGEIVREQNYGDSGFSGDLEPFAEEAVRTQVMEILDRKVVQIIYGDNANLAASAAKTYGALLAPSVRDSRAAGRLRGKLELFIQNQQPGYEFLYDAQRGLFRFGWNATEKRFVGWAVDGGEWNVGFADYLVNEFRGPTQFVVMRYGMPMEPLRNLGFWMKGRGMTTGETLFTLAPWEGSAFQVLGLSLFMDELGVPGWRAALENAVRINLDYSRQYGLPGFLSESYTGNGIEYSGRVGVPDMAVDAKPRYTNSPSLYTLGVAYSILPEPVEMFLGENWRVISSLFTTHGPWEGYSMVNGKPVERQTAAHVMSLILGGIGCGNMDMSRYLAHRGLMQERQRIYPCGEPLDLLGPGAKAVAWSPEGGGIQWGMEKGGYRLRGIGRTRGAITWTFPGRLDGVSPSNGKLRIRYGNAGAGVGAVLSFEDQVGGSRNVANRIAIRLESTGGGEAEVQIPLPATPGLAGIREVVLITMPDSDKGTDLEFKEFRVVPAKCPCRTAGKISM